MAEELQGLLDRIRKEGLDKAEEESATIVAEARQKAEEIKKAAEKEAARKIADAETEAQKFEQRSISAVEQAARDVVLSVGDAIAHAFTLLIQQKTSQALDDASFAKTIQDVVRAYSQQNESAGMDLLLSPQKTEEIKSYLNNALAKEMRKGLTIQSSRGILSGFSVVLRDKGIEHDFRGETLTAAFLELLRPQLGEIVKKAMQTIKTSK